MLAASLYAQKGVDSMLLKSEKVRLRRGHGHADRMRCIAQASEQITAPKWLSSGFISLAIPPLLVLVITPPRSPDQV
jgi:hypothetical protein